MNWLNEFNNWRKNYNRMTYEEHQSFYNLLLQHFPHQSQHTKDWVFRFFANLYNEGKLSILEIGGWDGELADYILKRYKNIEKWDNYEISELAKEKVVCRDERYCVNVPNDFIWNIILPDHYNILLSSHTIEHITENNFQTLIKNLPPSIKWIYFEAPLPLKHGRHWHNDFSTHILEWSWEDITLFMKEQGYELEDMGRNVRIYKRQ
jgi:hypothetical protein